MEDKSRKEIRLEKKKERKEKRQKFWNENKELVVQAAIALVGVGTTVLSIVGIALDHKMTREDTDYERAVFYDHENYVDYVLKDPMTNEEKREAVERQNHGEDTYSVLKDMGKI